MDDVGTQSLFARATVNRTWGLMFGAGIIDPVDDMGGDHPDEQ
ncbi:MAG: DUF1553 domain-containing protein [Planctomycetia bacterium]